MSGNNEQFTSLGISINQEDPTTLFELIELVGRGSYGSVYKAKKLVENPSLDEFVAIKVIALDDEDLEGEKITVIEEEIRTLSELDHPNIVQYFGSYIKGSSLWIVMEYCGGGSVIDLIHLTHSGLSEIDISYILREALTGLKYLHKKKKIHRDLKAANILLTENGAVKLADFGVAASLIHTFQKAASFVGSPYWMAPEVISGDRYNEKADIWSLAITAIEMAQMVPPNASVHPMRVLFLIPRAVNPPTFNFPGSYSKEFHNLLAACLHKSPSKRPSASSLLGAAFLKKSSSSSSSSPPESLLNALSQAQEIILEQGVRYLPDDALTGSGVFPSESSIGETEAGFHDASMKAIGHRKRLSSASNSGAGTNANTGASILTDPERNFGIDNPLLEIARANVTIPLPILSLDAIEDSALLTPWKGSVGQALGHFDPNYSSVSSKDIRFNRPVSNLLKLFEHHRHRQEEVLLTIEQLETFSRHYEQLSNVLKTILKI